MDYEGYNACKVNCSNIWFQYDGIWTYAYAHTTTVHNGKIYHTLDTKFANPMCKLEDAKFSKPRMSQMEKDWYDLGH